jgi:hypothetical protein
VETRVQRALQNRWAAGAIAIVLGYVSVWLMLNLIHRAYYDYYFDPRIKGGEYSYPEFRYTFGQVAGFLSLVLGLCMAALAGRCALFGKGANWAARSLIAFAVVFVLLIVGQIAGMALRDFGF